MAQSGVRRAAVIGGTGLMGAPTVEALLASKRFDEVRVITRGQGRGQGATAQAPPALPAGAKLVVYDRTRGGQAALAAALGGAHVVVDFVAQKPEDIESIVACHRASPLEHYVFISTNMIYPGGPEDWDISRAAGPDEGDTTAVYAWKEEDARVKERAETAPQIYGGHKLRCELALHRARDEDGLPFTVLRPPAVIGPRCDSRWERLHRVAVGLIPLPALPPRAHNNTNPNPGPFSIVFADDVASAVAKVVQTGEPAHGEAFNLCQAEAQTMAELVQTLQTAVIPSRGSSVVFPDPDDAARELAGQNFPSQGRLSIEKAQRVLGWSPTPVADFVSKTAEWHERVMGVAPVLEDRT